eukprot:8244837-Alexandrium_andersonii.AAC.1
MVGVQRRRRCRRDSPASAGAARHHAPERAHPNRPWGQRSSTPAGSREVGEDEGQCEAYGAAAQHARP